MFAIEVVNGPARVRTYLPETSRETLRPLCQKENVGANRLHQDAIMNRSPHNCVLCAHRGCQAIASISPWPQLHLLIGIRPASAVEIAQRNPAPFQIVGALQIVLDLDVHDGRAGLLNLSDAAQLHAIREAGGDIAGWSVGAQIARRNAGKKKEDQKTPGHDHQHERRSDGQQSVSHGPRRRGNAWILCMRQFSGARVPHLHQNESDDSNQQEARKSKHEHTAHRKYCGRQHHQERKHREHVVVARTLQREEPDDHHEEHKVDACG